MAWLPCTQLLALISCAPDRVDVYRELLWPGGNTFNIRQAHTVLRKVSARWLRKAGLSEDKFSSQGRRRRG